MRRYKYMFKFFINNWKMVIHLLFHTKRFGVNNEWWSKGDSLWGWSTKQKIWGLLTIKPLIHNYKMMIYRSAIGFVPYHEFMQMVSRKDFEIMYKGRDYDKDLKEALIDAEKEKLDYDKFWEENG